MKREYTKPTIHVEVMSLDMPVAASCEEPGEYYELREQGWFVGTDCMADWNVYGVELEQQGDEVCYHSIIRMGFSS